MRSQRNRGAATTGQALRRGFMTNSMRTVSTRSITNNLFVEGVPCGDKVLRKHRNGYPLASLKVLKPMLHKKRVFKMFECEDANIQSYVDYSIKIVRNTMGIGINQSSSRLGRFTAGITGSTRKLGMETESQASIASIEMSQETTKLKTKTKHFAKGSARLVLDNNTLHLFKGIKKKISATSTYSEKSLKKSLGFSWMHIYAIEKDQEGEGFTLVFYEGRDEAFLRGEAYDSSSYLFKVVSIKPKDPSEVGAILGEVYQAIRSQAQVGLESAKTLTISDNPREIENAESYFRLSVDLFSVASGVEDKETLEAMDELIKHLEQEPDENEEEVEFWMSRRDDLEGSLQEKQVDGDAVNGIVL